VLKRQRTILGVLIREVTRKMEQMTTLAAEVKTKLMTWLERAERIRTQKTKDKNKLYAMHAPEAECIGKGKARKPYEFGVKASIAVTHRKGLVVGARTFPGNPYDGHTLAAQIEQTTTLLENIGAKPTTAVVDLGYRGVDDDVPTVNVIHRGKAKRLTAQQKTWLRRRQAVEPTIGHLKADHRMDRCWLKGTEGDALHAVLCAAGFNIRWLLRAIAEQAAMAAKAFFFVLLWLCAVLRMAPRSPYAAIERTAATDRRSSPLHATGARDRHRYVLRAAG
jgi:transposase, IS5 family